MYSTGVPLALCHPHLGQINHKLHNGAPQRKSSQIASDLQPWTGQIPPAGTSVISSAGTLTVKHPRVS